MPRWMDRVNQGGFRTYPDCPLTLSIDYQPKANLDKYDATAPIRSGWGAMVF